MREICSCLFGITMVFSPAVNAASKYESTNPLDLTSYSIFELAEMEITIATKTPQKIAEANSAITVITAQQIQQYGFTHITEVFQMVPGMHSAQVNRNKWAVSSRGFSSTFSNKLLVLMDGRSLYTPVFGGVYWDMQTISLSNIDRIEIIRGPGATLWGANAVNGVINIITKKAADETGASVELGFGENIGSSLGGHYGQRINDNTSFAVNAKHLAFDSGELMNGNNANDHWYFNDVSFRLDWDDQTSYNLSVMGGWSEGKIAESRSLPILIPPFQVIELSTTQTATQHLITKLTNRLSANSNFTSTVYYDRIKRVSITGGIRVATMDIDLQYDHQYQNDFDLVMGMHYRKIKDDFNNTFVLSFTPEQKSHEEVDAFVQGTWALSEQYSVTLGSKLARNSYMQAQWQPNIRFSWFMSPESMLWFGTAKAVRSPSRSNRDIQVNYAVFPNDSGNLNILSFKGSDSFNPEKMVAKELGFRHSFSPKIKLDLAVFHNSYENLPSQEFSQPSCFPEEVIPPCGPEQYLQFSTIISNNIKGHNYGLEFSLDSQLAENWHVGTNYSWIKQKFTTTNSSTDNISAENYALGYPSQKLYIYGNYRVNEVFAVNIQSYFIDDTQVLGLQDAEKIAAYWLWDTQLHWQITTQSKWSFTIKNLFNKAHREFFAVDGIEPNKQLRSFFISYQRSF